MAVTGASRKQAGLYYDKGGIVRNVVHPDFGAKGDGTNDSQAFLDAIADLPANKGGIIVVPEPPGGQYYAVNVPITKSNVQIIMTAGTDGVGQNRLVPWDITQPVLTIGDGSAGAAAFQFGVRLRGISLGGNGPNGQGQIGIKIAGAVHKCSYKDISVNDFKKHALRIESGANAAFGSCARHYFDGFHAQSLGGHNRALISLDYNAGGAGALQYVTACYFRNLGLNGSVWGVSGRTATSGAVGALNDAGVAWVVNEWAGMAVTIVSGTGVGQTRDIASNTATQLVPTVNFAIAPDATSRYEIVGYCIENDGCEVGMTDSYLDVASWRSVRLNKDGATSPFLICNNFNIDGAASTDIVVDTPYNQAGSFAVSQYIIGSCNIDGYVRSTDGLTFKPSGRQYMYNQSQLVYPQVWGALYFQGQDLGDGSSGNFMGPSSGHGSVFQMNFESSLLITPGTGLMTLKAPGGTVTFTLFETTGAWSGTLRMSGGTVQLYSPALRNIELIGAGPAGNAKLVIDYRCGPVLPAYTVATRPTAVGGAVIYVSDGAGGANFQGAHGGGWVNLG